MRKKKAKKEQSKITNACEVCKKTIADCPKHFCGNAVTDQDVVRCVLYDMFTLALCVQALSQCEFGDGFRYELFSPSHPDYNKGKFDPEEVLKIAALIKIRILYDFLYNEESRDDFKAADFSQYGIGSTIFGNKDKVNTLVDTKVFTKGSVSKYVAHLVEERILKPKCIPQLKFAAGKDTTIGVALLILGDAQAFVETVIAHQDFPALGDWGQGYLKVFRECVAKVRMPTNLDSAPPAQ